jgi:hypothetical protein
MTNLRQTLLAQRPRRTKTLAFPTELGLPPGSQFTVKAWTAKERSQFETSFRTRSGKPRPDRLREMYERLVIDTLIDDDGRPVFTLDDLPRLKEMDSALIHCIATAAAELNHIDDDDLEEMAKNSSTIPADSSP